MFSLLLNMNSRADTPQILRNSSLNELFRGNKEYLGSFQGVSRNNLAVIEASSPSPAEVSSFLSHYNNGSIGHRSGHLIIFSNTLIERIERMWRDLGFPHADRKFYRETLFSEVWTSLDRCRELSEYLSRIQIHRALTVSVLEAIAKREQNLEILVLFLEAQQQKLSHLGLVDIKNSYKPSNYFKEDFVSHLVDLHNSTIETVKRVQVWRRGCWRPHSFRWKNENYLLKMKSDSRKLKFDTNMIDLLALLPLSPSNLPLVIINDQTNALRQIENIREDSKYVEDVIGQRYFSGLDIPSTEMALIVILEEERLQNALQSETAALDAQGVFIPTLRI